MLQSFLRVLVSLGIIGAGVGVMLALGSRQQTTRPPQDEHTAPAVQTVGVESHAGGLDIVVDGVVAPCKEISVVAEIAGRVRLRADDCRTGNFVARGSLLLEIDPLDYELDVERFANQRAQAGQDLEENAIESENVRSLKRLAEQELELRQRERERRVSAGSSAVSQSEIDTAEQAVVAAQNALQLLENQLRTNASRNVALRIAEQQAEIQWRRSQRDLDRCRITAPVDGVIVRDAVEQDGYVQKGQEVFAIEDTSAIEVSCNLKMEELDWLWRQPRPAAADDAAPAVAGAYRVPKTPATVIFQFSGRETRQYAWRGELSRFEGSGIDDRTRTVPCRVVVDDPRDVRCLSGGLPIESNGAGPPALVRGMYVTVRIHARPAATFVRVPEQAIQPGKFVWRVRGGRLQRVGPLELVQYLAGSAAEGTEGTPACWLTPSSADGLAAGDQLVITPLSGMQEGMEVQL